MKAIKHLNAKNAIKLSDVVNKVQSLIDIGMIKVIAKEAKVVLHPFCLSSLPSDDHRKAYIGNIALYYIIQYEDVFRAEISAQKLKSNYNFTVEEKNTGKPLAKYIDQRTIQLL